MKVQIDLQVVSRESYQKIVETISVDWVHWAIKESFELKDAVRTSQRKENVTTFFLQKRGLEITYLFYTIKKLTGEVNRWRTVLDIWNSTAEPMTDGEFLSKLYEKYLELKTVRVETLLGYTNNLKKSGYLQCTEDRLGWMEKAKEIPVDLSISPSYRHPKCDWQNKQVYSKISLWKELKIDNWVNKSIGTS